MLWLEAHQPSESLHSDSCSPARGLQGSAGLVPSHPLCRSRQWPAGNPGLSCETISLKLDVDCADHSGCVPKPRNIKAGMFWILRSQILSPCLEFLSEHRASQSRAGPSGVGWQRADRGVLFADLFCFSPRKSQEHLTTAENPASASEWQRSLAARELTHILPLCWASLQ